MAKSNFTFSNLSPITIYVCAVISCLDDKDETTCGLSFPNDKKIVNPTTFRSILIVQSGIPNNKTYISPIAYKSNSSMVLGREHSYVNSIFNNKPLIYLNEFQRNIKIFGINIRLFDIKLDEEPSQFWIVLFVVPIQLGLWLLFLSIRFFLKTYWVGKHNVKTEATTDDSNNSKALEEIEMDRINEDKDLLLPYDEQGDSDDGRDPENQDVQGATSAQVAAPQSNEGRLNIIVNPSFEFESSQIGQGQFKQVEAAAFIDEAAARCEALPSGTKTEYTSTSLESDERGSLITSKPPYPPKRTLTAESSLSGTDSSCPTSPIIHMSSTEESDYSESTPMIRKEKSPSKLSSTLKQSPPKETTSKLSPQGAIPKQMPTGTIPKQSLTGTIPKQSPKEKKSTNITTSTQNPPKKSSKFY